MKIHYIFIIVPLLALVSCHSPRPASHPSPATPYQRPPLREVSEASLHLDTLMIEAKMQQEAGNYEAAERHLRTLIGRAPDHGVAHFELSRLMMAQGRLDSALHHADWAVQTCDSNVWYRLQVTQCLSLMGNYQRLVQEWEGLIRLQPDKLDYYYELSNAWLSLKNVPKAVEALNRVERRVGVTEEVSMQKHRLWSAIERNDKALKEVEALAEAFPHEKKYHAVLAESHMQAHQPQKARPCFQRALEADPNDEYLHISYATCLKELRLQREAAEELRRGLMGPSLEAKSKIQLLVGFYTQEEFYGSCSQYTFPLLEELMAQCDNPAEMALGYGDVLMRQRRYGEAADQIELHLTLDSSDYKVWEALMVCLMEQQPTDWARLTAVAQRAQVLFPILPLPLYVQARAAEAAGHYAQARRLYEQYLTLRPDDTTTQQHLKEIESWKDQ